MTAAGVLIPKSLFDVLSAIYNFCRELREPKTVLREPILMVEEDSRQNIRINPIKYDDSDDDDSL